MLDSIKELLDCRFIQNFNQSQIRATGTVLRQEKPTRIRSKI